MCSSAAPTCLPAAAPAPPAPAPALPSRAPFNCALWPSQLRAFAVEVANYYLRTELGARLPYRSVWCATNGRLCRM